MTGVVLAVSNLRPSLIKRKLHDPRCRFTHPPLVNYIWSGIRLFHEGQHVASSTEDTILDFAAGVMFYVVVEELIPKASNSQHSNLSTIGFAFGFMLMMALDVVMV